MICFSPSSLLSSFSFVGKSFRLFLSLYIFLFSVFSPLLQCPLCAVASLVNRWYKLAPTVTNERWRERPNESESCLHYRRGRTLAAHTLCRAYHFLVISVCRLLRRTCTWTWSVDFTIIVEKKKKKMEIRENMRSNNIEMKNLWLIFVHFFHIISRIFKL